MQNDDYDNTPFAEPVVIEITDVFDQRFVTNAVCLRLG